MITRSGWITRHAWIGAMLFALGGLHPCHSSTFSIAPIRVELDEARSIEVLTVRNEGDAPVVLQAQPMSWTQGEDGVDSFAGTRDVVVAPAVLTIGPRSSQIVRVALRRPADRMRELSYRLFLQEVPQAASRPQSGLTVAVRLSLPVFVAPERASPKARVEWLARWHEDGSLELKAANRGDAHLQVFALNVDFDAGQYGVRALPGRYILPDAQGSWRVDPPPPGIDRAAPIRVHGSGDRGDFSVGVAPAGM
jgi:fimbrial chaperone protein